MPRLFIRKLQGKTKPKFILRKKEENLVIFFWKMNVLKVELLSKGIIVTCILKVTIKRKSFAPSLYPSPREVYEYDTSHVLNISDQIVKSGKL